MPLTNPCALAYHLSLKVGASPFDVVIDTGSSTTAVAGATCAACVDGGAGAGYTPGPTALDAHEETAFSYGEGSSWSGEVYTDDLLFPGATTAVPTRIASILDESAFFGPVGANCPDGKGQGILGLGPSTGAAPGTDSVLDRLEASGMPGVFAFQLCLGKGTMWLGGFDRTVGTADPTYTPFAPVVFKRDGTGEEHYGIDVADMQMNGQTLGAATSYGTAVLDTGSTDTLLPTDVYNALIALIPTSPGYPSLLGATNMFSPPTCVAFAGKTAADLDFSTLPHITVKLEADAGGGQLDLPPTGSYLRLETFQGKPVWCPSVQAFTVSGVDASVKLLFGDPVLSAYVTLFDREKQRAGFMPFAEHSAACP